jgi:hypothetical protein
VFFTLWLWLLLVLGVANDGELLGVESLFEMGLGEGEEFDGLSEYLVLAVEYSLVGILVVLDLLDGHVLGDSVELVAIH